MKAALAIASLLVVLPALAPSATAAGATAGPAADQSYNETLAQEKALKEGKTWSK